MRMPPAGMVEYQRELLHDPSCTWTPMSAGAYTLVVWARLIGHSANYDQYGVSNFQVIDQ